MRALKEEVEGLVSSLKEEGERVTSLKTQGVAVEEELETVLEVITQLCPHSQRSGKKELYYYININSIQSLCKWRFFG